MRLALIAAAFTLLGSVASLAHDDQGVASIVSAQTMIETGGKNSLLVRVHDRWSFVGCVSSHHDCGHHAREHGFHHHTVRHSHDGCPAHPHLACYGQN